MSFRVLQHIQKRLDMLLILGELMFEGKDQLFKSHLSSTNRSVMLIYQLQPEISFKYLLQIVFFYLPIPS